MKIAYIDEDLYSLEQFRFICKDIEGVEKIECFDNYIELLDCLKYNDVSLVFSNINMPVINGLDLIKYIKDIDENIEVAFITEDEKYALKAFEVGAFGYILKPYTQDKIENVIKKMIKLHISRKSKVIEVKTFGRFDVFVNGRSLFFSNKKAKEMFALLIDRYGGIVTMEQAIDILWEDRPLDDSTKTLYRIAAKNLRDTLAKENCDDILIETRGQRALDIKKIKCDYYDFANDPVKNKYLFNGEYMAEYSWGEYTLAKLFNMIRGE